MLIIQVVKGAGIVLQRSSLSGHCIADSAYLEALPSFQMLQGDTFPYTSGGCLKKAPFDGSNAFEQEKPLHSPLPFF